MLFGDVVRRPTILVIPRYYGCLPCRDYLRRLSERLDEVEAAGASALGISVGADYQAHWLMDEQGVRFPLLVDPDRRVYEALELPRRWWVGLNPLGWWNYARALARGNRQGRIIEPNQLPGLALLDADARAVWVHRRPGPRRLPAHRSGAGPARPAQRLTAPGASARWTTAPLENGDR